MKLFILLLLLLPWRPLFAEEARGTLIEVEDGDTLVVDLAGKKARIQLLGVDAPEDRQNPKLKHDMQRTGLDAAQLLPAGRAATQYLKSLVRPGDTLVLSGKLRQKDRYGRISTRVFSATGVSLNQAMVAAGHARPLRSGPLPKALKQTLEEAYATAKSTRQGSWKSYPDVFGIWAGEN
ncbi:thermonuclease family protein [Thiolapillus sp.]